MRRTTRVRGFLLALSLMLVVPLGVEAQTEADENAVYAAILTRYLEPGIRRIVLSDSTRGGRTERVDTELMRTRGTPAHIVEKFEQRNALLTNGLLQQFNQRNALRVAVTGTLDLPVPVELIGAAQYRALRPGDDVDERDWVRQRLPGSPGIITLTRVGFSRERDRALVRVYLNCGSRCGQGSDVFLRNRDGRWEIELWLTTLWI